MEAVQDMLACGTGRAPGLARSFGTCCRLAGVDEDRWTQRSFRIVPEGRTPQAVALCAEQQVHSGTGWIHRYRSDLHNDGVGVLGEEPLRHTIEHDIAGQLYPGMLLVSMDGNAVDQEHVLDVVVEHMGECPLVALAGIDVTGARVAAPRGRDGNLRRFEVHGAATRAGVQAG